MNDDLARADELALRNIARTDPRPDRCYRHQDDEPDTICGACIEAQANNHPAPPVDTSTPAVGLTATCRGVRARAVSELYRWTWLAVEPHTRGAFRRNLPDHPSDGFTMVVELDAIARAHPPAGGRAVFLLLLALLRDDPLPDLAELMALSERDRHAAARALAIVMGEV